MTYFGSKTGSGAFQAVIAQMPPHDTYIEAFAGSGVVFQNKPLANANVLLEIDPLAAERLSSVVDKAVIFRRDSLDWLPSARLDLMGRVLLYADPPYVLASRTSTKRYRHDFTDDDHRRLIELLRSLPGNVKVILSGYPSALYDELLADWRQVTFQVMTRGGPRTEVLWMNFPAEEVQWHTYAGEDRTERQRIKRKAARWARMYAALSHGERLAVLAAQLEVNARDLAQSRVTTAESDVDAPDYGRRRHRAQPSVTTPPALALFSAGADAGVYAGHLELV